MSDWNSQRNAFQIAIEVLGGRIDHVLPIAGIGERRSFPNRPNSAGFEKPDLKVIEVDEVGVIYTVSLAVQHFRQTASSRQGTKGRSTLYLATADDVTIDMELTPHPVMAVASVCGFYIHTTIPLYTAAKQYVTLFSQDTISNLRPDTEFSFQRHRRPRPLLR